MYLSVASKLIVASIAIVGLCSRSLQGQSQAQSAMGMGIDLIHAGNTCVAFGGNARADPFVENLKVTQKHSTRIFQQGRERVTNFPERLAVSILAALHTCQARETGRYEDSFRLNADFMKALQFEAYWKHGFSMRRTDITVTNLGLDSQLSNMSRLTSWWKYDLVIGSKDTPLTDALVILVLNDKGNLVSRLSGRL